MRCGSLEANCQHYVGRLAIVTPRLEDSGVSTVAQGDYMRASACSWRIARSYGLFRDGRQRFNVLQFPLSEYRGVKMDIYLSTEVAGREGGSTREYSSRVFKVLSHLLHVVSEQLESQ